MIDERFEWVDTDGAIWDLKANGLQPTWGMVGAHAPPVRVVRSVVAGQPGALLDSVEHDVRPFSLPVTFVADDELDFRVQVGAWARRMDPARGPGTLRFHRDDGTFRDLTCICIAGFAFTEGEGNRGPGWVDTVLEFEADEPYWRGSGLIESWPVVDDVPAKWFVPGVKGILPIKLNPSTIIGDSTIDLACDVAVYPVWVITGPGSLVTLTNTTTGRTLTWSGTIDADGLLVIDTRPGHGTVTLDDANAFDGLTAWDMWPFEPGVNHLDLTVTDSDPDTTNASALGQLRFLGP
jgi:hypothetical protein